MGMCYLEVDGNRPTEPLSRYQSSVQIFGLWVHFSGWLFKMGTCSSWNMMHQVMANMATGVGWLDVFILNTPQEEVFEAVWEEKMPPNKGCSLGRHSQMLRSYPQMEGSTWSQLGNSVLSPHLGCCQRGWWVTFRKRGLPHSNSLYSHREDTKMPPAEQSQARLCRKGFAALTEQLQLPWLSFHPEAKATHTQSELNQFKQWTL